MYKGIIFDFGNTLVSSASLADTLCSVFENEKAYVIGLEIENTINRLYQQDQIGQPDWYDVWNNAFEMHCVPFGEEIVITHLEKFLAESETYPYAIPLLSELRNRGIKLDLLSNKTDPTASLDNNLKRRGIDSLLNAVIWSSDIGVRKPSLEAFHHAIQKLELKPSELLMVGDSEIADIEGAKNAGIDSMLITEKPYSEISEANYLVSREEVCSKLLAITSNSSGPAKDGKLV